MDGAFLRASLRRATVAGRAVPVLMGASFKNKGVQPLFDAIVDFLPSPADVPGVAGKDPSDVIAEAATIGETLRSPQVVERAESLRPRLPGDARTAP